jgi:hypothetical protein
MQVAARRRRGISVFQAGRDIRMTNKSGIEMSGLPKSSQPAYLVLPGTPAIAACITNLNQLGAAASGGGATCKF